MMVTNQTGMSNKEIEELIEDVVVKATAPLLKDIEMLKIKVKVLEEAAANVPSDIVEN